MKIFQKGFNFSQDGPGNRLVIHLSGCNFCCPWCSNPEGMKAVGFAYEEISIDELSDYILRSSLLFFDGGGVTFTGGECTLQHGELLELLIKLKSSGINTAIETNASDEKLNELLPYVDYLIADLKHTDNDIHKKVIGCDNTNTLKNIGEILRSGRQIHIRIPLINGFNLDAKPFIDFLGKFPTDNMVLEVLPYHEYGKSKWTEEYTVTNGFVSDDDLQQFIQQLKNSKINIINT